VGARRWLADAAAALGLGRARLSPKELPQRPKPRHAYPDSLALTSRKCRTRRRYRGPRASGSRWWPPRASRPWSALADSPARSLLGAVLVLPAARSRQQLEGGPALILKRLASRTRN
jgi:hypothetical protein